MIGMRRKWDIASVVANLRPNAPWRMTGYEYNDLEWFDENIPKPTIEEIETRRQELEDNEPLRVLREIRDWYIQQSDWTQGADIRALRGPEWCAMWDQYRQELRDLPSSGVVPTFDEMDHIQGISWPAPPSQR